jgi:hypothetical protein
VVRGTVVELRAGVAAGRLELVAVARAAVAGAEVVVGAAVVVLVVVVVGAVVAGETSGRTIVGAGATAGALVVDGRLCDGTTTGPVVSVAESCANRLAGVRASTAAIAARPGRMVMYFAVMARDKNRPALRTVPFICRSGKEQIIDLYCLCTFFCRVGCAHPATN